MGLIWTDSFDDYPQSYLGIRYDFINPSFPGAYALVPYPSNIPGTNGVGGRRQTTGLFLLETTCCARTFDNTYNNFTVGFAHFLNRTFETTPSGPICQIALTANGRGTLGATIISINMSTDSTINVTAADGSVITYGDYPLGYYEWHYIEIAMTISSAGSPEVLICGASGWIDGIHPLNTGSVVTAIPISTLPGGTAAGNQLQFYGSIEGGSIFDDVFLRDDSILYGKDIAVTSLLPTGNGTVHDWGDYSQCNNNPPSESNYIQSTAAKPTSFYTYPNLSFTGNLLGVNVQAYNEAVLNDGGISFDEFLFSESYSGTGVDTDKVLSFPTFWAFKSLGFDADPQSNPWSQAIFNSTEFGVKWEDEH